MTSIVKRAVSAVVEKKARKFSWDELVANLERSGRDISAWLGKAPDTPQNRDHACHMIGIERWSQRRLRAALGEPLTDDEYDSYRPSSEQSLPALLAIFQETRAATIALARTLQQAGAERSKVPHNDFGTLSTHAWLYYLDGHANHRARRIH